MAFQVSKIDVWTGEIDDRAGALDAKLQPLAAAGADLTFIVARRQPHVPGKSVVYLGPLKGAKQTKAAQAAGLAKASDMAAIHIEAANRPGSAAKVTQLLAEADISLRGLSAATIGTKFMLVLAFDRSEDADQALKLIRASEKKGK